jgi:dienelactone hydrolase
MPVLDRVRRSALALALLGSTAAVAADLPAPDGPYAVGQRWFELTDTSRHGVADDAPRTLPITLWYPAKASDGARAAFLPGASGTVQAAGVAKTMGYAPDEAQRLTSAITHAVVDAPQRPGRYPIVIFNHGLFCFPTQNSRLAETLASHGYIVVAIAHPRDAADLQLDDGRVVKANLDFSRDTAIRPFADILTTSRDHDAQAEALARYRPLAAEARVGGRIRSWHDDMVFTIGAIRSQALPDGARAVLAGADTGKLALAGMSAGGMSAAAACREIVGCKAAINLDGQNFDPAMFDAPVGRPLLLMQSDWTRYPLFGTSLFDEGFSPNDLSYEPWAKAGRTGQVLRLRIAGTRHMGFTDLPLLLRGPKAAERFGDADPAQVSAAIASVSLAFLDVHVKRAKPAMLDVAITAAPILHRHDPAEIRRWAEKR